jgi:hypothetical protein
MPKAKADASSLRMQKKRLMQKLLLMQKKRLMQKLLLMQKQKRMPRLRKKSALKTSLRLTLKKLRLLLLLRRHLPYPKANTSLRAAPRTNAA